MNDFVSFNCGACQATLSIPAELAGISGPCPYCGTHVTSPKPEAENRGAQQTRAIATSESPQEPEPRYQARSMSNDETVVVRPRRTGWKVAAGILIFAGGVAGIWKFWEPDRKAVAAVSALKANRPAEKPLVATPAPRPEVLASADEHRLPPPADEMPEASLAPVPTAVARNVSTAAAASPPAAPVPAAEAKLPPSASPPPASSGPMSKEEKEIRSIVPASGHLEKPGTALIRFFAAKTWQERLKHSLAPEKIWKLMDAYYKAHADGPIVPEDIELTRMEGVEEDAKRHYYAFLVYMPGKEEGIPVSVEETKTGCLVEWRSFIEGKDELLAKFCSGWRKESESFRVLVRRGHYFESDVPNQDRREVFDISPPDSTGPYNMWADKGSAAYSKYFGTGERTKWNISSMMVLTLQWEKTDKGVEFIRLQDVVADTWHPAMLPK